MKTKTEKNKARKSRAKVTTETVAKNVLTEVAKVTQKPARAKTKAKVKAETKSDTVQSLDSRFNRKSTEGKALLPAKELTIREFGDRMTPARSAFIVACHLLQRSERFTEQEFAQIVGKNTRKSLEQVRATQPKTYPDGKIHRGLYALVSGALQTGLTKDKKSGKMKPRWAQGSLKCLAKTPRVGWGIGEYAIHPDLRKNRATAYPKPSADLLKSACETLV